MTESHFYAGRPEDITISDSEGGALQFPHVEEHKPRVSDYTQYILCSNLPAYNPGISLAAKAIIRSMEEGVEETALAAGGLTQDLLTKL